MAQESTLWTVDDQFANLPAFDVEGGGLCMSIAPVEDQSWGIEGYVFSGDDNIFGANALDWYRAQRTEDGVYIYGRETQSEWGLARIVQGDVWGGTQCGNEIEWHQPTPILASDISGVEFSYDLISPTNLLTEDDSWVMVALNLWLNDATYSKRLVIDLVLHHDCNIPGCRLRHFEDDDAFHYMHPVTDLNTLDLPAVIQAALGANYEGECISTTCTGQLPSANPTLQQFEFVMEVHNAEAATTVTSLGLEVRSLE